jgi:hypothetical protein
VFTNRFRPTLEHLEAREVLSANNGLATLLPTGGSALVQQTQTTSQTQVDYNGLLSNAAKTLSTQNVNVQNGVADVTQAAKAILENDIMARIPQSLGKYPLIGEVKLDRVTLDRLTLDKAGNFNGQMSITFKYEMGGTQYAGVTAKITNNQLSLDSDNALVKQFGKLDQRQREWQPKVTAALDGLRSQLMPALFGAQASAGNVR